MAVAEAEQRRTNPTDDGLLLSFLLKQGWFPRGFAKQKALLRLWLPIFRADCQAINSYTYAFDDFSLPCPVLCLGTSSDGLWYTHQDLQCWGERTSRKVEVVMVEGEDVGHNFWAVKRLEVLGVIEKRVGAYIEGYRERQRAIGKGSGETEEEGGKDEEDEDDDDLWDEEGHSPKDDKKE